MEHLNLKAKFDRVIDRGEGGLTNVVARARWLWVQEFPGAVRNVIKIFSGICFLKLTEQVACRYWSNALVHLQSS